MEEHEKQRLLGELASGRQDLLNALHGITQETALRAPVPGKWSVLECVEHLAISEDYLFSQILAARSSESPMVNAQREAMIPVRGLDRTCPVQSPEVGKPTGRFSTLDEAVQRFLECHECTVGFVSTCSGDLRSLLTSHPIVGTVNCYETLLMIAVHPHRHAEQIREIRAALNT